jgi:hypothetical protein
VESDAPVYRDRAHWLRAVVGSDSTYGLIAQRNRVLRFERSCRGFESLSGHGVSVHRTASKAHRQEYPHSEMGGRSASLKSRYLGA